MLQQAHPVKQRQPKVMLNILLQKAFLLLQRQLPECLQASAALLALCLSRLLPLLFRIFLAWFILLYYKICGSKELFELLSIAFRSLTMITHRQVLESLACHKRDFWQVIYAESTSCLPLLTLVAEASCKLHASVASLLAIVLPNCSRNSSCPKFLFWCLFCFLFRFHVFSVAVRVLFHHRLSRTRFLSISETLVSDIRPGGVFVGVGRKLPPCLAKHATMMQLPFFF